MENLFISLLCYYVFNLYVAIRDFFYLNDVDLMIWLFFIGRYLIRRYEANQSKK